MVFLKIEEIIRIHDLVIEETGGLKGISNQKALLMLREQPKQEVFGKKLYPSVFDKAAFYARTISGEHIFSDGNKRTSIAVIYFFLLKNNYSFRPPKKESLENFSLQVAKNKLALKEIASWIQKYSIKLPV